MSGSIGATRRSVPAAFGRCKRGVPQDGDVLIYRMAVVHREMILQQLWVAPRQGIARFAGLWVRRAQGLFFCGFRKSTVLLAATFRVRTPSPAPIFQLLRRILHTLQTLR
jgi:hypothetical protein